jgi:hypothetical protein
MSEIKNCPCCGGQAGSCWRKNEVYPHRIYCGSCDIGIEDTSLEECAKIWNNRTVEETAQAHAYSQGYSDHHECIRKILER